MFCTFAYEGTVFPILLSHFTFRKLFAHTTTLCCPHSDELFLGWFMSALICNTCADETEDNHGAIVSYNESKLAIEEMVMKETFSR